MEVFSIDCTTAHKSFTIYYGICFVSNTIPQYNARFSKTYIFLKNQLPIKHGETLVVQVTQVLVHFLVLLSQPIGRQFAVYSR